jgi:hypothetical protein
LTTKADYTLNLLAAMERRFPSHGIMSHAIALDKDGSLVLLINVGDCVWPCVITPDDLSDDPDQTAERLVSLFKDRIDAELENLITFKR